MSHSAQRKFCKTVKRKFSDNFHRVNVIDIGSLNINGCNRPLFYKSNYIGVDLAPGENVDIISKGHEYLQFVVTQKRYIDTIVCTEALEHDSTYQLTLGWMYQALRPDGLLMITCAGDGRKEHGTSEHLPQDSPYTTDYYKNVSNEMFAEVLTPDMFSVYHLEQVNTDLQFYGIKKLTA